MNTATRAADVIALAGQIARQIVEIRHAPDQLRVAAAVLREIADALDSGYGLVNTLDEELDDTARAAENRAARIDHEVRMDLARQDDLVSACRDALLAPWGAA